MKKLLGVIFTTLTLTLITTGCFFDEITEAQTIYTTIYPIEYITSNLTNEEENVVSIYPDGAEIGKYKLTKKLKNKYAFGKTFIYNGINEEKNIAVDFLNINKNINIIDAMQGMSYENGVEELWLDPANFLMVAQNIKNGLKEYNTRMDDNAKIDENYENFKMKISELDVELNLISKNSESNTIVVSDNVFKFLEKYNIKVISLDKDNDNIDKNYAEARRAIENGEVSYVILKKGQDITGSVQDFINSNNVKKLELETITTLKDQERKDGENYITLMTKNIESLKTELYD